MMDAVEFEILKNGLTSITGEMGVVLQRSSFSPNIRERMDASCALFGADNQLLVQAEHIPVHLGSMHIPLPRLREELSELCPGDQIMVNHPSLGGTHLPDITLYKPVFLEEELVGFLGTRAHHADIGGMTPGSMPGNSREVFQEGLIIPPVRLMKKGTLNRDVMAILLANTRTPQERQGDIMAQLGANEHGGRLLQEFIRSCGPETYRELQLRLLNHTTRMMETRLRQLPKGSFSGKEVLELEDGKAELRARVELGGKQIEVDFSGSSPACSGNLNAPLAVTHSAVYFFFRSLLGADIPSNSAFYRFFKITAPKGSILNPPAGAAVVGGNVETSQRVVDTLLFALSGVLELPAQSQGTMNNVSFGNTRFTYYETLGGGAGATRGQNGTSGVHVYMTNTKNTPVEVIEASYPLLCRAYSLRTNSGGAGNWRGGEGLQRHYEALEPCSFSVLSQRRRLAPQGAKGGECGAPGKNLLIRNGKETELPATCSIWLEKGDEVSIFTPGGGGYGKKVGK